MTKMSNLPRGMVEEVLSKLPLASLRVVKTTCKKWKRFSKSRSFAKKYIGQASVSARKAVMMIDFRIYLIGINLDNKGEPCIKREGKLTALDDSGLDELDVYKVFHCDGLLLCITKDSTKLVVWNPYSGQTRFIKPTHYFHRSVPHSYALGYQKSTKSCSRMHKILRFRTCHQPRFDEFQIYDINSSSWRFVEPPGGSWMVSFYDRGVSLNGNTYWFARKNNRSEEGAKDDCFLVGFDFTRERFGPPLPVPFMWYDEDTASLSSVREEQLAVLFQRWDTLEIEIWVTTKIGPDAVLWNTKVFLQVNMRPLTRFGFQFEQMSASFFIDEEKKVAVVFDKDKDIDNRTRNVAYIVGVDGSLREADLGISSDENSYPLVCSYVPSLVKLT